MSNVELSSTAVLPWRPYSDYSPLQSLTIGKSLYVCKGLKYPFQAPQILSDGLTISRKTPIMELHIDRHGSDGYGYIEYMRKLLDQIGRDLEILAFLSNTHPDFQGIMAYLGISHMARSAKRFGFETYPIPAKTRIAEFKSNCKDEVRRQHVDGNGRSKNTPQWIRAREINFKAPQMAFITPRRLADLYLPK